MILSTDGIRSGKVTVTCSSPDSFCFRCCFPEGVPLHLHGRIKSWLFLPKALESYLKRFTAIAFLTVMP